MREKNLKHIELLKNIAIILVLLGHSGCIYAEKWSNYNIINNESHFIKYITEYIYSFHMPLYVFISGYIYNCMRIKANKYNSVKSFILNKFKRLIIPYLVTGILFMIPIQVIFNVYKDNMSIINRIINGILLAKQPSHLWYLLMIFNVFVIFRCCESKIRDNKYYINLIILTILAIISIVIPNIYQLSSALQYLIYFYLGYIISEKIIDIKAINYRACFYGHLVLFNIYYLILGNSNIYIKVISLILRKAISILGIFYLYIFVNKILENKELEIKIINSKIYRIISQYNFYIYLLHQPIMLSIISVLKYIKIIPVVMYIGLFIVTFVLTLGISILIDKLNIKSKYLLFIKLREEVKVGEVK